MRFKLSPSVAALSFALMAPLAFVAINQAVSAEQQQQQEATKQVPLTAAQIDNFIAAQPDIAAVIAKLPEQTGDKPDPKVVAQLDTIAKKHKFASYDEYDTVASNIGLVLGGIDPQSKKYIGADKVLKAQIDEIKADKKMSAKDKKEQLDDLNEQLKTVEPVTVPANIELVTKNYDKLSAIMQQGQQQ